MYASASRQPRKGLGPVAIVDRNKQARLLRQDLKRFDRDFGLPDPPSKGESAGPADTGQGGQGGAAHGAGGAGRSSWGDAGAGQ